MPLEVRVFLTASPWKCWARDSFGACSDAGELSPPPTLGQHNEEIRAWLAG